MTILITRHDKIGDFVTALPMCKVLKEQTNHKVVMLVSKVNVTLAKNCDFIDEVIEYTDNSTELLRRIAPFKFDVSISGYIDFNLGFTLFWSRIPVRIAPATKIAQIFFNKTLKQRRSEVSKTEWMYNLDLLKEFDESLVLDFKRPLIEVKKTFSSDGFIIFHVGSGGSSEGNLTLDDYLKLAKSVCEKVDIIFSFGPDDYESKKYITTHVDFKAQIKDEFTSLEDFMKYIAYSKVFISTSTGPMHLAGLTNTTTLSFFGSSLFASSKRWATINDITKQNNYELEANYSKDKFLEIQNKLKELID